MASVFETLDNINVNDLVMLCRELWKTEKSSKDWLSGFFPATG